MKPIVFSSQSGNFLCTTADVLRIESSSNYSRIYFTGNKRPLVVAKVLSHFQTLLPAETFTRVHRSHLVNMHYISNVIDCKKSGMQIHLVNGEVINVSRRKKADFYKKLFTGWDGFTARVPSTQPSYGLAV